MTTVEDADDMGLGELIDLAKSEGVPAYHSWVEWLEHHHDPAKSALVDLLVQRGIITDSDDEGGEG